MEQGLIISPPEEGDRKKEMVQKRIVEAQLVEDFLKYCNQIGLVDIRTKPRLITSRKELHVLQVSSGQEKYSGKWGSCHNDLKTIFVDTGIRVHHPSREYKGWRNPQREQVKHRSRYIDFRNTLVHELVHYRWPYLKHGKDFEKRIYQILRGRTFEPKEDKNGANL